jgi:hypothetical protein
LDELNYDLTKVIESDEESHFEDVLNAMQFSFAMNFDDEQLWIKIYEAMTKQLGNKL